MLASLTAGGEGAIGKVYRSTGSHWKVSLAPSMLAGRIASVLTDSTQHGEPL